MEPNELGIMIQKRRANLSLNQEDLADMTGITTRTIYLIESGKGNPSIGTLKKILNVLGLELTIQIKKKTE